MEIGFPQAAQRPPLGSVRFGLMRSKTTDVFLGFRRGSRVRLSPACGAVRPLVDAGMLQPRLSGDNPTRPPGPAFAAGARGKPVRMTCSAVARPGVRAALAAALLMVVVLVGPASAGAAPNDFVRLSDERSHTLSAEVLRSAPVREAPRSRAARVVSTEERHETRAAPPARPAGRAQAGDRCRSGRPPPGPGGRGPARA